VLKDSTTVHSAITMAKIIILSSCSPLPRVFNSLDSTSHALVMFCSLPVQVRRHHTSMRWAALDTAQTGGTKLLMSSVAMEDSVTVVVEQPASPTQEVFEVQTTQTSNINEIINNGLMVTVGVAALAYVISLDAGMWHGWSMEEILTRVPIDAWEQYSHTLAVNPIATKACTSATVYTIGDIIAQRTEGTAVGDLDRMRVARSMAAGLVGHGPLSHYWYNFLDGFFQNALHWTAWWAFIPKVIIDQTMWSPIWNNTYILLLGLMKMESLDTIWNDMKRSTIPLIVSGLKLWPAVHVITYGFLPVENRLLWVDLVEIMWVTILATQAAGNSSAVKQEDELASKTAVTVE
jgi:protein Mpv17